MSNIISILNHKGGVGKTTTAANLSAALARKGLKVIAVDLDGQANLTESLGCSTEREQNIYGAMRGQHPLPIVPTSSGIDLVPSCLDLSAAESELMNEPGRELILRERLLHSQVTQNYDYVIIDCPPSLGLLTLNALTCSNFVIIPVQAQFLAMRGMAKLLHIISIVQQRLNPKLQIGGIVITQYNKRKTLNKTVNDLVKESFCSQVFNTVIRDNVSLAEAPVQGQTIYEYAPNSNGAIDYEALAEEIVQRLNV